VAYNQNEEITLRDEIKSVEAYVYIQQMRFLNIEVRYRPLNAFMNRSAGMSAAFFPEGCI
jgi:hypothetical protein